MLAPLSTIQTMTLTLIKHTCAASWSESSCIMKKSSEYHQQIVIGVPTVVTIIKAF